MLNVTHQPNAHLAGENSQAGSPFNSYTAAPDPFEKIVAHLTSREMTILQLVAESYANKQIAAALEISIKTVEKHRQSLMRKLNVHDTAGITRLAIFAGIIKNSIQLIIV